MNKKNNKRNGLIIFIIFIGLFSLLSLTTFQASLFGQEVWLPRYFTGECVPIDGVDQVQKVVDSHTDQGQFYECTSSDSATWIPQGDGFRCEYEVTDFLLSEAYACDGIVNARADLGTKCEKIDPLIFDTASKKEVYEISSGDSIYINTDKVFGDAILKVRYPAYGLRLRSADGFVSRTTTSCILNSIDENTYHTLDARDRLIIQPNIPFNTVTGTERALSAQVVTLSEVENGAPIYITRPGNYFNIQEAEDGFLYVDTQVEFSNSAIECIPGASCSTDAKIINIQDQECNALSGTPTGFTPVVDDTSKLCKYSCIDNRVSVTSDCVDLPEECPSDKPIFNVESGLCESVSGEGVDPTQSEFNLGFVALILLGSLGLIAIMVIIQRRRNKI